jgi:hypothetical protein
VTLGAEILPEGASRFSVTAVLLAYAAHLHSARVTLCPPRPHVTAGRQPLY